MVSRKFEQLMKDTNVLVRNLQKQETETSFLTVRTDNFIEDSHVVKKFSRLGFDVYEPSLKKHRAENC